MYTQLSDVEDETNGLLTYDRDEYKVDQEKLAQLNERLKKLFEKSVQPG